MNCFHKRGGTNCPLPSNRNNRGKQKLNCANAQELLRIIQSIPSPKAEPFKLWLAKIERMNIKKDRITFPLLQIPTRIQFYN
ncbi:MAG: BRO family protein [Sporocytophaga sp.]|nr:BRO family protein [Sporocytophaga sp.]